MEMFEETSECTVCWSDTLRLCSPCGDPVCHNCHCPNGCDDDASAMGGEWRDDSDAMAA